MNRFDTLAADSFGGISIYKKEQPMKKHDAFEGYAKAGLPAALLSLDLHILSRNDSALALSRKFRIGSNFSTCLDPTDSARLRDLYFEGEVCRLLLYLPESEPLSALFIPTEREKEPCFLLICFPEHLLRDLPLCLSDAFRQSFTKNDASLKDSETAAEFFTKTFRHSFVLGLSAEDRPEKFLICHACAYLNRFSDRSLFEKGFEIEALCTKDSFDLPLYNFPRITALLAGICLFCLLCSENGRVRALFYTVNRRAAVQLTFLPDQSGKLPKDRLPLLFDLPLDTLCFDATVTQSPNGQAVIDILCRKAMPIGSIRTPEDEAAAQTALEQLLCHLLS